MPAASRTSRVTLATVAQRAGVSTTTVSLILSGREEWLKQFRPDTIAKVRGSAERLGYRSNLFASGLPTRASPFFALIIRDIGHGLPGWHHWAFEGDLLGGVVKAAQEEGLYPIIASAGTDTDEQNVQRLTHLLDGGVCGTIVRSPVPALDHELRHRLQQGQRVMVAFPHLLSQWPTNAVAVNNAEVGRAAANLLAQSGARTCCLVSHRQKPHRDSHRLRAEHFLQHAEAAGLKVVSLSLPGEESELTNRDVVAVRKLGLDGMFALDAILSIQALRLLQRAGITPGRETALVGVNVSKWQSSPSPRITSVDVSWKQAGMAALRELARMVDHRQGRCERVLIDPHVTDGETCPVPGRPPISAADAP